MCLLPFSRNNVTSYGCDLRWIARYRLCPGVQFVSVSDLYGCNCNSRMAAAVQISFALSGDQLITCLHYLGEQDHAYIQGKNWKI